MENWTLFVTGPHLETGRKSPEFQTLAGLEPDSGHGRSPDQSGFEALSLLVRMAVTAYPAAAWFAGIEGKKIGDRRKLGFSHRRCSAAKWPLGPPGIKRGSKTRPSAGGALLPLRL